MPTTLLLYLLRELLKLLVISATVLMVVLAVAFSVRPISESQMSLESVTKLILYAMPVTLEWAMPLAVAFASTMVFYRMAADNEITACAVSGISYRSLLVPGLVLGLVITLGMFTMSNFVIPRFWALVQATAQQDLVGAVVNQLNSGRTFNFDRTLIVYADEAVAYDPPANSGTPGGAVPFKRIVLTRAAVSKSILQGGREGADYTGERAVIDLYTYQNRTYAVVKLVNAMVRDPETQQLVRVKEQKFTREFELPFEQRPEYMSLPRLQWIRTNPDGNLTVRKQSNSLRQELAVREVMRKIQTELENDAMDRSLMLIGPSEERYTIRAGAFDVTGTKVVLRSARNQPVSVRVDEGGRLLQAMIAERGELKLNTRAYTDEPRLTVELEGVTVRDPAMPTATNLDESRLSLLRLEEPIARRLRDLGARELLDEAEAAGDANPEIASAARRLRFSIESLWRDVAAAIHQRAAMAVCSLAIMLLGAVMSMMLRHQVPLMIFFWCFVPTLMAIIAIKSGENVITSHDVAPLVGIIATWAGVAALGGLIFGVYVRLARH